MYPVLRLMWQLLPRKSPRLSYRIGRRRGVQQMPQVRDPRCKRGRNSLRRSRNGCHIPLKPKGMGHGRHFAAQADLGLVFL